MSDTEAAASVGAAIDEVVARYIKLRDRKAEMEAEHKKTLEPINTAMERCEAYLLNTLNGMGVDSVKTSNGTAYTKVNTAASVADWPLLLDFIKAHELWPMLERRVSKAVVQEYRDEHNDLPPGVNWTETRVLNIRRT